MSGSLGEHFIICLHCKIKIPLPDFPITTDGNIRFEEKNGKLNIYAKCPNIECGYDNLYSVLDLLAGKSTEN